MPAIAPLVTEYRAFTFGYLAVGTAGAAIHLAGRDEPGRALGSFGIMAGVLLVVLGISNLRWVTSAARNAPEAPDGAPVEPVSGTLRRVALELVLVAILVTVGLTGGSAIGMIIAGMAFGTGLVNLLGWAWLVREEGRRGVTLFRETPPKLIAMGRRPVTLRHR